MTAKDLIEKYEKRLNFIEKEPYRGDERRLLKQFIADLKGLEK